MTRKVRQWPDSVRPIMVAASFVGNPVVSIGLAASIFLIGIVRHRHELLIGAVIALTVILIGDVVKLTIRRVRPFSDPGRNRRYRSYSFPSGHAVGATVSFGLLALLSAASGTGSGLWMWLTDGAIVLIVGVSRVYLGAHYPSDVLAGWLIGGLGLTAVILAGGF